MTHHDEDPVREADGEGPALPANESSKEAERGDDMSVDGADDDEGRSPGPSESDESSSVSTSSQVRNALEGEVAAPATTHNHPSPSRDPGDNSGESSSTTTTGDSSSNCSEEGKSERSGGGYSGDCSASEDQSSDDTGGQNSPGRRPSSRAEARGNDKLGASEEDEEEGEDESDGKAQKPDAGRRNKAERSAQLRHDASGEAGPAAAHHGRNKKSKRRRERGQQGTSSRSLSAAAAGTKDHPSLPSSRRSSLRHAGRHDDGREEDDEDDDDDDESDSEVDRLQEQIDQVALEMLGGDKALPQWNGVRIRHPMDPRIDLSSVGWNAAHAFMVKHHQDAARAASELAAAEGPGDEAVTLDSYQRIMDVVRPWFMSHGVPFSEERQREENAEAQGSGSSEGFTSFFTTTHSGSSSGGGGGSNSSDQDKKPPADPDPPPSQHRSQRRDEDDKDDDASETSSMVVQARSKRKHHRAPEEEEEEEANHSSHSSGGRRVRIQDAHGHDAAAEAPAAEPNNIQLAGDAPAESSESSSASSSEPQGNALVRDAPPRHFGGPPHFVTDVSSSNRTDSTGSNVNSSTSGSGSGGNTASGSGTGSGSNQGSSGSGNENDGKGSSEEVLREDNSGDGTNEGSDEAEHSQSSMKLGIGLTGPRHDPTLAEPAVAEAAEGGVGDEDTLREKKLIDKKRKRIEMRREYEAQQQSESSENNEKKGDTIHRPGKPVTMDQVLQFSKIPRLVVQSTPPFAVVHTNAAYCRLSGLDSHKVVGRPVRALISLPEGADVGGSQDEMSETAASPNEHVLTSALGTRPRSTPTSRRASSIERLVVTCGLGHFHSTRVHTKPHQILGKNVSFFRDVVPRVAAQGGNGRSSILGQGLGSPDTSLTGSHDGHPVLSCRASIAPVVSTETGLETMIVSEREGHSTHAKAKRRKFHTSDPDGHKKTPASKDTVNVHKVKHAPQQTITHYVIQLQPQDAGAEKQESEASLSSNATSVEARLLGLSKPELLGHRKVTQIGKLAPEELEAVMAENDAADSHSLSTGPEEPVSTVG